MAETVGTKTEQKTSAGKEVYKTPEGESVSEKSVTIKFGDNAYVNAPSIHNGKRYTEDEIKEMLLEGTIKPTSRHDTLEEAIKAAKTRSDNLLKDGGMAKRMAEQMELFKPVERGFEDGGLMDEGGTVDPVSGNDVPPGSTREEVRDDIPAQLSEGEFVFPADVVRYFGLEKLMQMRQEAKAGLARMEAMGQMGNADEATLPDNLPFTIDDLDMEDEEEYNNRQEFAVGGVVPMPGFTGISNLQPALPSTTGYTPYTQPPIGVAAAPVQPGSQPQVSYTTATGTTNLPTFAQTVGSNLGQYDELKTYVNDAGQIRQIPFKNGQPIYPIPEGFRLQEKPEETVAPESTLTTTGTGMQQGDGGDGYQPQETTRVETAKVPSFLEGIFGKTEQPAGSKSDAFFNVTPTDKFTGSNYGIEGFSLTDGFDVKSEALAKASATQGMYQMALIGPGGVASALAKEFGLMDYNMKDMAVAGQTAKTAALNAIGYNDTMQLSSVQQADLVGKAITAAHEAAKAGKNVEEAINSVLNTKEATAAKVEALNNLRDQLAPSGGTYKDLADIANQLTETYSAQRANLLAGGYDNELGGKGVVTDGSGKAVQSKGGPVMTGAGKQLKDALETKIGRTSAAASLASSDIAGSAAAYTENIKAGKDFGTSFEAFRGSSEDDDNNSGPNDSGKSGGNNGSPGGMNDDGTDGNDE